jgi:hypothetical protein
LPIKLEIMGKLDPDKHIMIIGVWTNTDEEYVLIVDSKEGEITLYKQVSNEDDIYGDS